MSDVSAGSTPNSRRRSNLPGPTRAVELVRSRSFGRRVTKQVTKIHAADQLRSLNGLRTDTVQISLDEGGRVVVHGERASVNDFSTPLTMCGTTVALLVLFLLGGMTITRFFNEPPSVAESLVESHDTALELPDIAITVNVPNLPEGALLNHLWPEFSWVEISDGFTNRSNNASLITEARTGAECDLVAGYNQRPNQTDGGAATWPVFCVLDSSRLLSGRFGDPMWAFLSFSINRCGCSNCFGLSPAFARLWTGACATTSIEAALGDAIPVNVWFRFPREDWQSARVQSGAALQPARGQLERGNWTWWIYEVLSPASSTMMTIELRHNTATVNEPLALFGATAQRNVASWFDWFGYVSSPSGSTSADFIDAPLFAASLRVAWLRRVVTVRHATLQEVVSEVSGSWSISLALGALVVLAVQRCSPRQREGAPPARRLSLARLVDGDGPPPLRQMRPARVAVEPPPSAEEVLGPSEEKEAALEQTPTRRAPLAISCGVQTEPAREHPRTPAPLPSIHAHKSVDAYDALHWRQSDGSDGRAVLAE